MATEQPLSGIREGFSSSGLGQSELGQSELGQSGLGQSGLGQSELGPVGLGLKDLAPNDRAPNGLALGGGPEGPAPSSSALEVEWKFSVPRGYDLPDFSVLGRLGATRYHDLNALYFDTPQLELTEEGSSLRRRSGGTDAGWHLKVRDTSPNVRKEITAPIEGARPPHSLRKALPETLQKAVLLPWARLQSKRAETPILTEGGKELAVICVDEVRATGPDLEEGFEFFGEPPSFSGRTYQWREVEVELSAGVSPDEVNLKEISSLLRSSGMEPSRFDSKIHQALEKLGLQALPTGPNASEVAELIGRLQSLEQAAAEGGEEATHASSCAVESLEGLLRLGSHGLDESLLDLVLQELRWYAGGLEDAVNGVTPLAATHPSPRFEMFNDLLVGLIWAMDQTEEGHE